MDPRYESDTDPARSADDPTEDGGHWEPEPTDIHTSGTTEVMAGMGGATGGHTVSDTSTADPGADGDLESGTGPATSGSMGGDDA